MAPALPPRHPVGVPRGVQRGLSGIAPEEDPLPSEAVTVPHVPPGVQAAVSGELLAERRRESLGRLRALLGDRPDGFTPEEWRVVGAAFAPAPEGAPGTTSARAELLSRALACFPGHPPAAAARLYREALARPHVAGLLGELRAVEMLDVVEQRAHVRESLHAALGLRDALTVDLAVVDPSGCAKLTLAVVAAAKALMDLDGLRARPDEDGDRANGRAEQDVRQALAEKFGAVMSDLAGRQAAP